MERTSVLVPLERSSFGKAGRSDSETVTGRETRTQVISIVPTMISTIKLLQIEQ
jgi:hypothetical protein